MATAELFEGFASNYLEVIRSSYASCKQMRKSVLERAPGIFHAALHPDGRDFQDVAGGRRMQPTRKPQAFLCKIPPELAPAGANTAALACWLCMNKSPCILPCRMHAWLRTVTTDPKVARAFSCTGNYS